MINECLIKKLDEESKKKALAVVPRDLESGINYLTEEFPELLDDTKVLTKTEVRILAYCICKYYGRKKDKGLADMFGTLTTKEYDKRQRKTLSVSREKYAAKVFDEVLSDV